MADDPTLAAARRALEEKVEAAITQAACWGNPAEMARAAISTMAAEIKAWLLQPSTGPLRSDEWNEGFDFLEGALINHLHSIIAETKP